MIGSNHSQRIDLNGQILISKMVESEATQAIDLQWMVMACDPNSVERETCDELPVSEEKYEDEYETSPSQEPNLLSVSLAKSPAHRDPQANQEPRSQSCLAFHFTNLSPTYHTHF